MNKTLILIRILFLVGWGVGGYYIAGNNKYWTPEPWQGSFWGLAIGLFIILIDRLIKGVSLRAFSSATFGLLLGLILAWLVRSSELFIYTSKETQWILHLIIYLTFGYLGTMLALRSNRDEFSLLIPYIRFLRQDPHEQIALLDTSSIIDGRISDLCKSGFLSGTLVIPNFILDELQSLADSNDATRRMRGRHGLDLLNELKKNDSLEIKIHEAVPSSEPVDTRLIQLAQLYNGRIVTTDYNLGRIAELQKIPVMNVHLLANILKAPLAAGEKMRLQLIREGREPHQAVGFLPDGTMIVVNQARHLIGQETDIVVSGAIQTAAGRMVFADLASSVTQKE